MRAAFQTLRGDQRRVFVGAVLAALRRRDQPDVRPSSEEVLRAGVDLGDDAAASDGTGANVLAAFNAAHDAQDAEENPEGAGEPS